MSAERTTARGKSGVACHNCGTAYDTCTRAVLEKHTACCGRCRDFDMHDEREAVRFDDDDEETIVSDAEQVNHWSVGEIPPEPEAGSLVADRNGTAWIRIGETWQRAGMITSGRGRRWPSLLVGLGPLTRLVPAPLPQHAGVDVDTLLRVNDALRAELARHRDVLPEERPRFTAPDLEHAARTSGLRRNVVAAARRLLDAQDHAEPPQSRMDTLREAVKALDAHLAAPHDES